MSSSEMSYIEKPAILADISYDESAVIEASAGTGKTYTIERMVVDLIVEQAATISDILVVTFTERATEELVRRVRQMLRTMLDAEGETDPDPSKEYWEIGEQERDRLQEALLSFDQAPVYTIHGFCNRVLQEYAFQNRQLLELDVLDRTELFDRVFPKVLRDTFPVDDTYKPVLEAYLEDNSTDDLNSLLQKSTGTWEEIRPSLDADELAELEEHLCRFDEAFDEVNQRIQDTIENGRVSGRSESKIERIRQVFEAAIDDYRDSPSIWNFLGTLQRVSKTRDDPIEYYVESRGSKDWMPQPLLDHLTPIHEAELSPTVVIVNQFAAVMEERLSREKSEKGLYTYDDMLEMVRNGVSDPDMGDQLIETLRDEFQYAIIDEFQDTDPKQWEIFRRIFYESGSSNPCYLVGDPKQAIYGFRGADVRVYRQARDTVDTVLPLSTNYRSTPDLVEAYNRVLRPGKTTRFFSDAGNNSYDKPVDAGFKNKWFGRNEQETVAPIVVKNIKGESVNADQYRRTLGRNYAREIRELLEDEDPLILSDDEGTAEESVAPGDIFVLVTSGREADLMSRYLRAEDVPYSFYKQDGLFTSDQARHFLAVLKATIDPTDRSRRLRAWTSPFFDVPLPDVEQIGEVVDEDHPLFQRLIRWNELAESGRVGRLVQSILHDSGILRRVLYRYPGERAYSNYQQLGEKFIEWWRTDSMTIEDITTRLGQFVREERTPGDVETDEMYLESERSSVQIMTMYKAKGLEAPVVFLYGGWGRPNNPPYTFYPDDDAGRVKYFGSKRGSPYEDKIDRYRREEDERLMYVAMTRAEGRLYLPMVENETPSGPIGPLMNRLNGMIDDDRPSDREGTPEHLIDFETIRPDKRLPSVPLPVDPETPDRTEFPDVMTDHGDIDFDQLRINRRLYTESYSSVSRNLSESQSESDEYFTWEEKQPAAHSGAMDEGLPGGRKTGLFVHELFETIDFDRVESLVGTADGFSRWKKTERITSALNAGIRKYDLGSVDPDRVLSLLWHTLTEPVHAEGVSIDRLSTVAAVSREREFWLPIPDNNHESFSAMSERSFGDWRNEHAMVKPFEVKHGYLRGYVDVIFEWNGKIYAADWKTDTFYEPEQYHPEQLAAVVSEHYEPQKLFYTLGLARMVARSNQSLADRFGGLFYFFVRGMAGDGFDSDDPRRGVYFYNPDVSELDEVQARSAELLQESLERRKASEYHD
jgi:exodeoxyribonuclease V beta subunit